MPAKKPSREERIRAILDEDDDPAPKRTARHAKADVDDDGDLEVAIIRGKGVGKWLEGILPPGEDVDVDDDDDTDDDKPSFATRFFNPRT